MRYKNADIVYAKYNQKRGRKISNYSTNQGLAFSICNVKIKTHQFFSNFQKKITKTSLVYDTHNILKKISSFLEHTSFVNFK